MLPLIMKMTVAGLSFVLNHGKFAAPLARHIEIEIVNHLGYIDGTLAAKSYLLGDETSKFLGTSISVSIAPALRVTRPSKTASRLVPGSFQFARILRMAEPSLDRRDAKSTISAAFVIAPISNRYASIR